ncbi:MAG: GTP 3',8-cyclase MoaA [Clostridiales Family XIII bacterium]|jgi:cyclic pyranopterin phosphate synthase|nr:GTP 3',8-cyclase MoaA [Clostridiales Family XIII bacterium]
MKDGCGREINYLRLSVTDLCDLRCIYCMPESGVKKLDHTSILSVEEIEEIVRTAAGLGITKVRLTGGEPLVRRGIDEIVRRVAGTPGIEEVALTTNGTLLPEKAEMLKAAGVGRVNISLDTLDPDEYRFITRTGNLADALRGIDAALDAGLTPVKINAVLMGGVNDDQIEPLIELTKRENIHVRFIEIMPIGECAGWNKARFIGLGEVTKRVPELRPVGTEGVAELYRKDGYPGTVGLIHPISSHFCPDCNRVRITPDGTMKPCLHSSGEIPLKGLHGAELAAAMRGGIFGKPMRHYLEGGASSDSVRNMNAIGG